MFKALIGDIFESKAFALVNTINTVGVMGKGVASEFKKRYPQMFVDYKHRCAQGRVRLGEPYLYKDLSGTHIINFPTKGHWRSASRQCDISAGLDFLAEHVNEWEITSVALPPLGCGNGGLEWSDVGPLIYRKLAHLGLDIELYAPYGTPKAHMTEAFLNAPSQLSLDDKGTRASQFNVNLVALLEVLRRLEAQPYANPVGRTIYQKLAYVVTEMGIPTGFTFNKGHYGPFSEDAKRALSTFANQNWLTEETLGRMITLRIAPQYEKDRNKFLTDIKQHERRIDKAVDLFSRIKSTEQAENVITVLYACRRLKQDRSGNSVAEQDVFDYILKWKKAWNTDEKKHAVADAIRNLVMLGWVDAVASESLLTDQDT
ncbi:MAG: Appr-1-p processing protein [Gammaproteobacteria bacterium]|nr:Appr-1-p processing protein [Gammaproteobacteria bacterium]